MRNPESLVQAKAHVPPKLQQLISQGEHEQLDFKKEVTSEIKIAKAIVSFANNKGGILLIGINDNGTVHGIKAEEELFMLERASSAFCKPPIALTISQWHLGKKTVLEVHIPEGKEKPYFSLGEDSKWWAYVRVGDQSLLASTVGLEVLKKGPAASVVRFTSSEEMLLAYLNQHSRITLSQFTKLAKIPRRSAVEILADLIRLGVIREHQESKPEFYSLT